MPKLLWCTKRIVRRACDCLSRLAESAVQAKLGSVVIGDGCIVIVVGSTQSLDCRDDLLRADGKDLCFADRLLHALEMFVERFNRVLDPALGMADPGLGRLRLRVGIGNLGGNTILETE